MSRATRQGGQELIYWDDQAEIIQEMSTEVWVSEREAEQVEMDQLPGEIGPLFKTSRLALR